MDLEILVRQWQAVLDANARLGGESSQLHVEVPAAESEVAEVERALDMALPLSLRDFLLTHAKRVHFSWFFPDDFEGPEPLRDASYGGLDLSLDRIAQAEWDRRDWIENVLSGRDDPALRKGWDDVIAFHDTGCGDLVAIDVLDPDSPRVVSLSHDEDKIMEGVLGRDFQDFLARWSAIGCVGPDPYMFETFLQSEAGPLDPDGANARLWRQTIGLGA